MLRLVDHIHQMEPGVKHTADIVAVTGVALAWAEWLPAVAALLSTVWVSLRIYEHVRWIVRGRRPEEKP